MITKLSSHITFQFGIIIFSPTMTVTVSCENSDFFDSEIFCNQIFSNGSQDEFEFNNCFQMLKCTRGSTKKLHTHLILVHNLNVSKLRRATQRQIVTLTAISELIFLRFVSFFFQIFDVHVFCDHIFKQ